MYSQIKFKTTMLKSSLCNNRDAYILVKMLITITGRRAVATARKTNERNQGAIFQNCEPFIDCIIILTYIMQKIWML